jgi:hypothetical protein
MGKIFPQAEKKIVITGYWMLDAFEIQVIGNRLSVKKDTGCMMQATKSIEQWAEGKMLDARC